ncbi:thiamine pyrophosphate-dependent enzyme [Patescibacteria group bacterium]
MPINQWSTQSIKTWCPGCPNHMILNAVEETMKKLINEDSIRYSQENFAMSAGVGCHAKIFDYLNISGLYGLHGRAIPTALGIKLGNPWLTVMAFAGDGDTYSEGMAHFIHAGRYNADMTLFVHDNQSFSLTTGQSTPTSQEGFVTKAEPAGDANYPINPIKLALASDISFISRTNARDINHMTEIFCKAIKHKGFSYVEIIQDCLVFNPDMNNKDELMYKIVDNKDKKKAEELASEWDYNSKKGKIPIGVIYQIEKPRLEEKWPILNEVKKGLSGWKGFKKFPDTHVKGGKSLADKY